ncbi:MAG: LLM class flavin-dependent oxidoreductase [Micropepsaceae bacterium]
MKLSVLDLAPVIEGNTPRDALLNARALAQHAERLGYQRFWMAEHHNMVGIASAATSVALGFVAEGTSTIRIGSGGIMLPNHSPMVIAEQFGTLESLYPGRIDLGLGRAPGTDQRTLRALRRGPDSADQFPRDVQELQAFLAEVQPGQAIQAVPGGGLKIPVWILGSSTFGAQLAGLLGLPYAFASHFAPDMLMQALAAYRQRFQPSEQLAAPYSMACVNVICADTDTEARRLFTSLQQAFANMMRNARGKMQPPIDDIETYWSGAEKAQAQHMLTYSFVGSPQTVKRELSEFIRVTGIDELMVTGSIYDHDARLKSFELLAGIADDLYAARAA